MKLHDQEYVFEPDGSSCGQYCSRLAVPGGWLYVFGWRDPWLRDRKECFEQVKETSFVPDSYAFHVEGRGKGKPGEGRPETKTRPTYPDLDF